METITTSQGVSVMSAVEELTTTSGGLPPPCGAPADEPLIALASPRPGAVLNSSTTVPVSALVGFGGTGGDISSVAFTAVGGCGSTNTLTIGTATATPYTAAWQPPAGVHTITAVADDGTSTITSQPVQIAAGPDGIPPPCPTPPPSPAPSS